MIAAFFAAAASLLQASPSAAQRPAVGERYEILLTQDAVEQRNGEKWGSSHDQDVLVERVVGVRADGLELEYDLPDGATREDRARSWQFPARVLKPERGPTQLLNAAELERRVEAWLKRAKWPRAVCGHWIFTWNAFKIDCDPQSVLQTIAAFDLRIADLREAAAYGEPGTLGPAPLARAAGGAALTVRLTLDPDVIRRNHAEQDVVLGEITRKPLAFEAALRERAKETASGTMTVTFELDAAGAVRRKTSVVRVETTRADGTRETHQSTAVLERRPIGPARQATKR